MAANTEIRWAPDYQDQFDNLNWRSGGTDKLYGTPQGCTVPSFHINYTTIADICVFHIDITINRNGSSMSTLISIPALPFKTISHSSFVVSYCQAVFKANGNDNSTMISAAAYAETQSIYFNQGFSGRTWSVHQGELISNGSIVITGAYMMK